MGHLKAKADKERYEAEMRNYDAPPVEYIGGKKQRDPNAPKRGLSAFLYYCEDARPNVIRENPGKKISIIAKILGEKWKMLPEEQKLPYRVKAEDDKERYNREMAAYREACGGGASRGYGIKREKSSSNANT